MTLKIKKWLQQIPGRISGTSNQKSELLEIAKILRRTLNPLQVCDRGPEKDEDDRHLQIGKKFGIRKKF